MNATTIDIAVSPTGASRRPHLVLSATSCAWAGFPSRYSVCSYRDTFFANPTEGIRVYGDRRDNWVPTRSVWNEHGYHVNNIEDDGLTIPATEAPSWEEHNTFRLNRLRDPREIAYAPDVRVNSVTSDGSGCPTGVVVSARVQNQGTRGVPAGLNVAFYALDDTDVATVLAVETTTRALFPGTGETIDAMVEVTVNAENRFRFYAVVDDDGTGAGAHNECHEDNNTSATLEVECVGPG